MTMRERILVAAAVLAIGVGSLLPLWRIEIWAPQYPEGLMMQIGSDRIVGNVDQINILNHYIGMKKIKSSEFIEFKFVPGIFALIVGLGLAAAYKGERRYVTAWLGSLACAGLVAFVDFFKWSYDYGHNLNPDAPIKVPGLSYQPPLIGHKQLLNISSYSLPDWGGYLILISVLIIILVIGRDKLSRVSILLESKRLIAKPSKHGIGLWAVILLSINLVLAGCTQKAEPLVVGEDHCANCHMQISDARFGGEVITVKGRILKFDSIPCLLHFLEKEGQDADKIYVSDYYHAQTLIDAKKAHFLVGSGIKGPMGEGAIASTDPKAFAVPADVKSKTVGKVVDWNSLTAD